jgi:uncharacterized protein Yka (UPF0111/DUF47 family)
LETSNQIPIKNDLRESLTHLMEVNDIESDIADLTTRLDDLTDKVEDDLGRMSYIRQLTAEFLDYLNTLNSELTDQVKIPNSIEKMNKMMGRSERKRYYMSKFRL